MNGTSWVSLLLPLLALALIIFAFILCWRYQTKYFNSMRATDKARGKKDVEESYGFDFNKEDTEHYKIMGFKSPEEYQRHREDALREAGFNNKKKFDKYYEKCESMGFEQDVWNERFVTNPIDKAWNRLIRHLSSPF